jgi:DNA-directed RNA polymerase specialized sigma24 family protein
VLVHAAVAEYLTESRKLSRQDGILADLIAKAAAGNGDAFTRLYNKYSPVLKQAAKGKAKGAAVSQVDDIVQNTWLKFYEKELGKIAKKIADGQKDPGFLVAVLKRSVMNATMDANKKAARKGLSYHAKGIEPSSAGRPRQEKKLGVGSRKIIRAAFKRALAKANLKPNERIFIGMLFGGGEGFAAPKYGSIVPIAKKAGIGKGKIDKQVGALANKTKTKFLKHFCNDKELCDLLPHYKGKLGRAKTKGVKIPGLGANVCKDVGVCTEFFWKLSGDHFIVEDESIAEDLVLSWLMGALTQGD